MKTIRNMILAISIFSTAVTSFAKDIVGHIVPSRTLTMASQVEAMAQEKGKAKLAAPTVHPRGIKRLTTGNWTVKAKLEEGIVRVDELWMVKTVAEMEALIAKRDGKEIEAPAEPAPAEVAHATPAAAPGPPVLPAPAETPVPPVEVRRATIIEWFEDEMNRRIETEGTKPPFRVTANGPAHDVSPQDLLPNTAKKGDAPQEPLVSLTPPPATIADDEVESSDDAKEEPIADTAPAVSAVTPPIPSTTISINKPLPLPPVELPVFGSKGTMASAMTEVFNRVGTFSFGTQKPKTTASMLSEMIRDNEAARLVRQREIDRIEAPKKQEHDQNQMMLALGFAGGVILIPLAILLYRLNKKNKEELAVPAENRSVTPMDPRMRVAIDMSSLSDEEKQAIQDRLPKGLTLRRSKLPPAREPKIDIKAEHMDVKVLEAFSETADEKPATVTLTIQPNEDLVPLWHNKKETPPAKQTAYRMDKSGHQTFRRHGGRFQLRHA